MAPAMNLPPLNFAIQALGDDGALTTIASSTDATVAYLEQLVHGFQDAINNRVLSPSAPAWQHLSERYEMGSKLPLHIDSLKPDCPPPLGVEDNLRELSRCCSTFPDYRIGFSRRSTEVDEDKGLAKTLAVLKVAGLPSGVLSNGVMLFDWKQIAGSWTLIRTTCFRGPGLM